MTTLYSTLSENHRCQAAEFRRMGYFNNGWDRMQRWDGRGSTTVEAGITGPSQVLDSWTPTPTTASGVCTLGVHVFRYRYMDSTTGYVSDPSEEREIEVTAAGAAQLTFAINTSGAANIIRSTDTKVDRIIVEMTTVGSTDFFKAAEALNTASSVVVSIADATLENAKLPWPADGMHPPPTAKNLVSHRDRLWLFGQVTHEVGNANFTNGSTYVGVGAVDPDWRTSALGASSGDSDVPWLIQKTGDTRAYEVDYYDSGNSRLVLKSAYAGTTSTNSGYKIYSRATAIWISRADYPEGFQPDVYLNTPHGEGAGDITAGLGYGSSMIFFSLSGMTKFAWDTDPFVDGVFIPLSNKYGALNQRVVIEVEGTVYAMDRRGITAWRGVFPQVISRPINPRFEDIDWDYVDNFHCCFFPDTRCIRWFVTYEGSTSEYPHNYFQLDVDTGAWSVGTYYQGISESRLVPTSKGQRVVLGDENGHTWFADQGTADGVPGSLGHITVGSGSTAATINTSTPLPVVNVGLQGCYAFRRATGGTIEARLITSNDSSSFSLAAPFGAIPAAGDVVWIGGISSMLRTRIFSVNDRVNRKKRTTYLSLGFEPTEEARYLMMRVYEDRSADPKEWSLGRQDLPGTVWPGNDTLYADTDWLIDMSRAEGAVEIPIGSEWRRFFEVEFEILEPDADFKLLTIQHSGQSVEETP